ncbi:MAG TPA: GYD domain-containing protein [Verrucomicrobiota bacterium]|nr:GYD domain-containing protein [Verrucomicrobiota bacterium]
MPTYISLIRFTDKGASAIHKSTTRARAFAQAAERAGVHVEGQYWLLGDHDGLLVLRADSAGPVRQCLRDLVSAGYVRTSTSQAFTAEEMEANVSKKRV